MTRQELANEFDDALQISAMSDGHDQGRAIAFVGPSIRAEAAQSVWDITYLPPIQRGQLVPLCEAIRPRMVLVIDGYFFYRRAVLHREIMHILNKGIHVLGASSIGALRACELRHEGMKGIGRVYEWYCENQISGDDEVAIMHSPCPPFVSFVMPMVTVRFATQQAVKDRIISKETGQLVLAATSAMYFGDRALPNIAIEAEALGADRAELVKFILYCKRQGDQIDIKRMDALLAIEFARGILDGYAT